jgi:hypothetical protein
MHKPLQEAEYLKGWQEMFNFLGQPVSVSQRWAKSEMPVETWPLRLLIATGVSRIVRKYGSQVYLAPSLFSSYL